MSKPDLLKTRAAAVALILAAAVCAQAARAQSGRKGQKPPGPPPAESAPPQGESESGQKQQEARKKPDALVSFVVMRGDELLTIVDPLARDGVAQNFIRRLGASAAVSVTDGGKGRRQDARTRAKSETSAYVVLFQMEEENFSQSTGRVDSRTLVIKTYVYTPKTADLKYTDTVFQRPYRQTARVGGVPIPLPTGGVDRYPSQHELEQAARDAADRLLARFQISPPPDN